MANYLDVIQRASDSMNSGIRGLGQSVQDYGDRKTREEEIAKKEEAERVRQERLSEVAGGIPALEELTNDPNSTYEDFVGHESTQRIIQEGIESGDPNILRTLDPYREIYNKRYRDAKSLKDEQAATAEKTEKKKGEKKKEDRDQFKLVLDLSQKYAKDKTTDRTKNIREAFGKIQASGKSKTGPGDLSLIFNYMKMLDPGSVVRESEFRSAAESGSLFEYMKDKNGQDGFVLPAWLLRFGQKAKPSEKGAFLLPEQRKQFLVEAGSVYGSQLDKQEALENQYRGFADDIGADHSRIFANPVAKEREALTAYQEALKEEEEAKKSESLDGPQMDILDPEAPATQEIIDEYTPAFEAAVARANEMRAAKGEPPMSDEEKEAKFLKVLENNNIILRGAQ